MLTLERNKGKSSRVFAALDIGTSKVCCVIMSPEAGAFRLRGFGHHRTQGLKAGVVVDPERAERTIRTAVGQAERMAAITIDRVIVAVTCGRLRSANFTARAHLSGPVAQHADIARVFSAGEAYATRGGRSIVQLTHGEWSLDGLSGISDPLGLAGRELAVPLYAVTADEPALRHLLHVVERCYLEAEDIAAAPYASALAVTSEEERQLGTLCIDLGGGTTTLALFNEGRLVYADGLPVGGSHITYDVARTLAIPLAEAERIKTLYGTLMQAQSDDNEVVSVAATEEGESLPGSTTRAQLRSIIEPRMQALYGLVTERLAQARLEQFAAIRVVLTGGASQLVGLPEWWCARTGAEVRLGLPRSLGGIPSSLCSPAFATVIGLILAARQRESGIRVRRASPAPAAAGYLGRIRGWIRESF